MDIQEILPSTDQRSLHYAEPPNPHYHPSTQPQTHPSITTTDTTTATTGVTDTTSSLPTDSSSLATIPEYENSNPSLVDNTDFLPTTTITMSEDPILQENDNENNEDPLLPSGLNPALLLSGRFDKRKSSPAILGLPFGITDDPQLDLHLSQHRNSIEAAMLLANFNRVPTITKETSKETSKVPAQQQWQDDLSVAAQTQEKTADQEVASLRRHSYDVGMNWNSMPQQFRDRTDLFNNDASHNITPAYGVASAFKPVLKQENDHPYYTGMNDVKHTNRITWTQDGLYQSSSSGSSTPTSLAPYPLLHPHMYTDQRHPSDRHDPSLVHPLAHQSSTNSNNESTAGQKREFAQEHYSYSHYGDQQQQSIHPHHPHHVYLPPQQQQQQQQSGYYYPNPHHHPIPPHTPHPSLGGKLPLPTTQGMQSSSSTYPQGTHPMHLQHPSHLQAGLSPHPSSLPPGDYAAYQQAVHAHGHPANNMMLPPPARPKRKRVPKETEEIVEAGDADFPDMCPRDVELAKTDPEARPRRQKLRFEGDMYTPKWVRYNGQSKEGLCDTCQPGRWLQLKNSAYWYHKQFYHGISSVSGAEFVQPVETRWVDQDLVEGLCHQCHQWVAVSNVKRKNSVLWFRHAHKCHVYHKPKNAIARRP
ncbi:uncharacterized protein BX664DRAFT_381599 [Halteromyces radiatus]|uniref:uncharacterized protein n=1 Tax=Halteromyces radiatus TaxID=101107 RepID=UPI00221E88FD|nr:uncharacterized protein BX664DRAFT_381599 [Halteromyces radiatus]KAI8098961.1 hypothetical protein BX664DRAFT_381599 [Halteromyces radiatus]